MFTVNVMYKDRAGVCEYGPFATRDAAEECVLELAMREDVLSVVIKR